jgi:hypothetical protein
MPVIPGSGERDGGQKKNNWKIWSTEEEKGYIPGAADPKTLNAEPY